MVALPEVEDDAVGNDNLDNLVSAKEEDVEIHEIGHQKSVIIATQREKKMTAQFDKLT